MDPATRHQVEWARSYDAAGRLSSSPTRLAKLVRPAQNSFHQHSQVPEWAGVELLRGWAHLLAPDMEYDSPGVAGEWRAVLEAIRNHPAASTRDKPPQARPLANTPGPVASSDLSTEPKRHRDPAFLEAKQGRLWEPHVAPINAFVDRIRAERGAHVPYVDPDSGGIDARVLFVLESPARPAAHGSGMLSVDNNDETAANLWRAYRASELPRTWGLHWNAVPWFIGDETHEKNVTNEQVVAGHAYLLQLLELAPRIQVVIAMGRPAQRSVERVSADLRSLNVEVMESLHPSPRNASRGIAASIPELLTRALAACDGLQGGRS